MSNKSPFAIHKALIGIGGEPKSIKRLRSGDLLIETLSAVQTKSFLLAKTFLDSPVSISPHKSLNSCRGVISETDLLNTPDAEILDGFSGQGVIQIRRITIKKDAAIIPTKHIILTFNSPKLPPTIKAGYLNCKIRPYVPNPLRCFKCQRFGHSQTSCRGQLTCSRCASVGHSSTDCTLEPKCINCSQPHTADSKLCPKWKTEKQIQEIKTNKNITYLEARKLLAPPLSQTYSQAVKSSITSSSTQTDENITKIICPPLKLLQKASALPKQNLSLSIPSVSTSSAQADLLPYTSPIAATMSESQPPIPLSNNVLSTTNTMFSPIETSSTSTIPPFSVVETPTCTTSSTIATTSESNSLASTDATSVSRASKRRKKRRPTKNISNSGNPEIEIKMAPHKPRKSSPLQDTSDEDMIMYDVEEEVETPKKDKIEFLSKEYWKTESWRQAGFLHVITPRKRVDNTETRLLTPTKNRQ